MKCYDDTEEVKLERVIRDAKRPKAFRCKGESIYKAVKGFAPGTLPYTTRLTLDIIKFLRSLPNATAYLIAKIRTCPIYKKWHKDNYGTSKVKK